MLAGDKLLSYTIAQRDSPTVSSDPGNRVIALWCDFTIFGEIQWSIAIHKPHGTTIMEQSIQMEHCLMCRISTLPRNDLCCLKCILISHLQCLRLILHR